MSIQDQTSIPSVKALGKVIRAVRVAAGLTQADAAALCGVSAPFLNNLERGKETARIGLVLVVCQGLGIDLVARLPQPIDLAKAGTRVRR